MVDYKETIIDNFIKIHKHIVSLWVILGLLGWLVVLYLIT